MLPLSGNTAATLDYLRTSTLKALFPKLLSAVAVEAMTAEPGGKGNAKTGRPPGRGPAR